MRKRLQFLQIRIGRLLFPIILLVSMMGISPLPGNIAIAKNFILNKVPNLPDVFLGIVEVTVTGTVTNSNGEPIPGVTVSVLDTSSGTATDLNGNYVLTVPEGST